MRSWNQIDPQFKETAYHTLRGLWTGYDQERKDAMSEKYPCPIHVERSQGMMEAIDVAVDFLNDDTTLYAKICWDAVEPLRKEIIHYHLMASFNAALDNILDCDKMGLKVLSARWREMAEAFWSANNALGWVDVQDKQVKKESMKGSWDLVNKAGEALNAIMTFKWEDAEVPPPPPLVKKPKKKNTK